MAGLVLYVVGPSGERHALELPPSATVADLQGAAEAACGAADLQLSFAGAPLDQPALALADAGLGSQAVVHAEVRRGIRWTACADTVRIEEDRRRAVLHSAAVTDGNSFKLARGDPLPAGASASWGIRWHVAKGGIRNCGVMASKVVAHNNHGTQDPPASISYEACDRSVFRRLLGKPAVKVPSFDHGDIVHFRLAQGVLQIARSRSEAPQREEDIITVDGLGQFDLCPFVGFYSSNDGDAAELI
eukprot:TRINITY_DN11946_c0_g1_i1.p1 TRINITY_DN11946_c0_g1~~TRINITY_DN11946_c0_g1_i1.p1  ORF type:complete len:268 (+),score=68.72 TRINITY_DN11946_c0_g1_i1:71-805(+)